MEKIDFAIKVDGLMWWGKAVKPVSNDGLTCALQHTAPIMIRPWFGKGILVLENIKEL